MNLLIALLLSINSLIHLVNLSMAQVTFTSLDENETIQSHVCGGFAVNSTKGWIITAAHCVGEDNLKVDGEESTLIRKDGDFAIVSFPPMSKPPLEIEDDVEVGEDVIAVGYAYGDHQVLQRHISSTKVNGIKANISCKTIALDGGLAPGMSGGPIVNRFGKVVGLTQASTNIIGLGCNGKEIKSFLKESK